MNPRYFRNVGREAFSSELSGTSVVLLPLSPVAWYSFGGNTHSHCRPHALHGVDPPAMNHGEDHSPGHRVWSTGGNRAQAKAQSETPPPPSTTTPPGVCLDNCNDVVSSSHCTWPWEVLRARLQLGRKLVSEDKAVTWRRAELNREMRRNWAPLLCLNSCIQFCLKPFLHWLCSWANKFYLCLLVWASFSVVKPEDPSLPNRYLIILGVKHFVSISVHFEKQTLNQLECFGWQKKTQL